MLPSPHLAQLQAELSRLKILLQLHTYHWQLAERTPGDFQGLHISPEEARALAEQPVNVSWGDTVELDDEDMQTFYAALTQAAAASRQLADQADQPLRWDALVRTFALNAFEANVLLLCLAPNLDLNFERLYSYLQDDVTRKRPTINLALEVLSEPGLARWENLTYFDAQAPLFRHALVEKITDPQSASITLAPDETLLPWLLGRYRPRAELASYVSLLPPDAEPLPEAVISPLQPVIAQLLPLITPSASQPSPIISLYGPDVLLQTTVARALSAQQNRPLLLVNLTSFAKAENALAVVRLALRDAQLTGALPALLGWETIATPSQTEALFAELNAFPTAIIVGSRTMWQPRGQSRERRCVMVEIALPTFEHRQGLWKHYAQSSTAQEVFDVQAVAAQFALTAEQIRDAAETARDEAVWAKRAITQDDLFAAARAHSSAHLGGLARKVAPRHQWADLILPDDQLELLREMVNTVRGRARVLEAWGLSRKLAPSAGITALFAGPPGTGKTMAAGVMAAELGLEVYQIELSAIVSKFIGETEKNLDQIFTAAQSSNAILFFDEADAIFGKRSEVKDAHDRYANIEVSYLLQRMETYDGVTILATNLRANLDDAFTRRLHFAIDFPFPDEESRLRLWQTLFPPEVPRAADLEFAQLARKHKLAGGNIRNVIAGAAYLAAAEGQPVSMRLLLHSIRRELQKMGRLVHEQEWG